MTLPEIPWGLSRFINRVVDLDRGVVALAAQAYRQGDAIGLTVFRPLRAWRTSRWVPYPRHGEQEDRDHR